MPVQISCTAIADPIEGETDFSRGEPKNWGQGSAIGTVMKDERQQGESDI